MRSRKTQQLLFAARLIHAAVVAGSPARRRCLCDETVHVFKAADHSEALKHTLKIGRDLEHTYNNSRGQAVAWRFVEVVAVTEIRGNVLGKEVSSRLFDKTFTQRVTLRTKFHPERSKPQWSVA